MLKGDSLGLLDPENKCKKWESNLSIIYIYLYNLMEFPCPMWCGKMKI